MNQSRLISLAEAVTNVVVGYGIAIATQLTVFPVFGLQPSLGENLLLGVVFTGVSLLRSYLVRRAFENWRVRRERQSATGP